MMKYLVFWLSFGLTPRRERNENVRVIPGHTVDEERSFARRMKHYRLHPYH